MSNHTNTATAKQISYLRSLIAAADLSPKAEYDLNIKLHKGLSMAAASALIDELKAA